MSGVEYLHPKDEFQQDLVEGLQELLERARKGEIKSLIGCCHTEKGTGLMVRHGVWNWNPYATVGMLESLKTQVLLFEDTEIKNSILAALEQ